MPVVLAVAGVIAAVALTASYAASHPLALALVVAVFLAVVAAMTCLVIRTARRQRVSPPLPRARLVPERRLPRPVESGSRSLDLAPFDSAPEPAVADEESGPAAAEPEGTCGWDECSRPLDDGTWPLTVGEPDGSEHVHLFCSRPCLESWLNADQLRRASA